jgi:hypothetical protein
MFSSGLTALLGSNRVYFFFHSLIWHHQQKQNMVCPTFSPRDGSGYCFWNSSVHSSRRWTVFINWCHYFHLLTYLLTLWNRVLLEKLTSFQLVKKFSTFYGTRRFTTAFTSAGPRLSVWTFHNLLCFYGQELIAPHPTHGWRTTPCWVLIRYFRSYPPYCRPFLHPQPEDTSCCGDRDPLIIRFSLP